MLWTLILVVATVTGATSQTIDFPDRESCDTARTLSVATFSQTARATGVCVYKGRLAEEKSKK
ncbi:hypothetical protein C3L29_036790 [Pseudomonas sp. MWU12-2534b]|nr:hypothetical protein C3L29_036790 [Pseudomonas sp. MWU12-2534b]